MTLMVTSAPAQAGWLGTAEGNGLDPGVVAPAGPRLAPRLVDRGLVSI